MSISKYLKGLGAGLLGAALLAFPTNLSAKEIKIGVIYDYSGPLAAGGSSLQALGAKIMIDYFNSIGGVEGYKINAIYADAQSKPEIAINEAVRLIEQEKVDMLMGFYSSAQCVPVSAKVDAMKKFVQVVNSRNGPTFEEKKRMHRLIYDAANVCASYLTSPTV